MDLENNRIPTKFRHPMIPVTGPTLTVLPKTAKTSRVVGTVAGWALHELGVSMDKRNSISDAINAHSSTPAPRNFLDEVERLSGRRRLKAAYTQLKTELDNNSNLLSTMFGAAKVNTLRARVDKVLADYIISANA